MGNNVDMFKTKLDYLGYKCMNADRVSLQTFKNFVSVMPSENEKVYELLAGLPTLSLDEVRELSKAFYEKYFSLHDVLYGDLNKLIANAEYISASATTREYYDKVNSFLVSTNPFDLDINLVDGHSMVGKVDKPIMMTASTKDDNRKVYFSNIDLGKQLSKLSAATLIHEVAHTQQEHNIGYAEDYFNKEVISIFLEKVAALEMDPTGELLRISEIQRFNDLLEKYKVLYLRKVSPISGLSEIDEIESLMYLKSGFYAEKLFDMYLSESKQKNKDKYFYQIQDVFDGKITVEDFIRTKNITPAKTQDLSLLKRHMK